MRQSTVPLAAVPSETWQDGAPSHIPPQLVETDRRIYRRLVCGTCGHRGQRVQPQHAGRSYRLVCSCKKCGAQVEA